jgi:hypothetical protein
MYITGSTSYEGRTLKVCWSSARDDFGDGELIDADFDVES